MPLFPGSELLEKHGLWFFRLYPQGPIPKGGHSLCLFRHLGPQHPWRTTLHQPQQPRSPTTLASAMASCSPGPCTQQASLCGPICAWLAPRGWLWNHPSPSSQHRSGGTGLPISLIATCLSSFLAVMRSFFLLPLHFPCQSWDVGHAPITPPMWAPEPRCSMALGMTSAVHSCICVKQDFPAQRMWGPFL